MSRIQKMVATHRRPILAAAIALCACSAPASAQSFFDQFVDPKDGAFDVGDWLGRSGAFLPVPLVVTEPALGFGLGAAALFFHGKDRGEGYDPWAEPPPGVKRQTPSISAVAGLYTTNDSWVAAGAHQGIWKNDTIRYLGALGMASMNLEFYVDDTAISFNIESLFLLQDIRFRLPDTDFFLGVDYLLTSPRVRFDDPTAPPGVSPESSDANNAGLGLIAYYDDRDNYFTPTDGLEVKLQGGYFGEWVGGDFNYPSATLRTSWFRPIDKEAGWYFGSRLVAGAVGTNSPFYGNPYVELRGVPLMRYQGEIAGSLEAEVRWNFTTRWSVLGFGGVGGARYESDLLGSSGTIFTGGAGFRYLLARPMGLHAGVDVAVGPESTVVYLQVGSAL